MPRRSFSPDPLAFTTAPRPWLRWTAAVFGLVLALGLARPSPAATAAPDKPAPRKTGTKSTPAAPAKSSGATKSKAAGKTPAKPAAPAKSPGIARSPYIGAIAVDAATGQVLIEDNADARGYPASVLKLMDLLLVLEHIDQRQLSLQDQVVVSPKAAKTGGSQVWLADKESFSVEELLYALMIQSANDAAVALAEKVAGSTDAFVELMNRRAQALGMKNTTFHSVHGLPPGPGQQPDTTTPRDFAILCRELLKHAEVLTYTSTRERPFRPNGGPKMVLMRTHNHLLGSVEGCDGLKTGYFANAGFSIAATAARGSQRVIVVVLGSSDRKVRDAKAAEWVAKAFAAAPKSAAAPAAAAAPTTPAGTPASGLAPARSAVTPPPLPGPAGAPAAAAGR